jgi:multidrug efflux pump
MSRPCPSKHVYAAYTHRISGVEGIRFIESSSEDGRSVINVEFDIARDIDGAANDIRDRVASILDDLPEEADPAEIQKVDSNEEVIMWLNLFQRASGQLPGISARARNWESIRMRTTPSISAMRHFRNNTSQACR